jgi:hypothetical protein
MCGAFIRSEPDIFCEVKIGSKAHFGPCSSLLRVSDRNIIRIAICLSTAKATRKLFGQQTQGGRRTRIARRLAACAGQVADGSEEC